jgi:biopolymer transport protein TolR
MDRSAECAVSAEPNVTPMIDVLLVLLVIFMLMVPMQLRIDAQIPDPDVRGGEGAVGLVLEVGAGGRFALNRQPVPAAELETRLRDVFEGRPDRRLVVRGARGARYQEVVRAMDVARGAGARVLALQAPEP